MRWALAILIGVLCACRAAEKGPYQSPTEVVRNTGRADELAREAAGLIESDAPKAEELLREALTADLFHGPAHNNLGVLYLKGGKLYEAAHEFEWARKLMPGHPDPRLNLALTLEAAGQSEQAVEAYTAALEVYPRYVPAVQGLARLTLRCGKEDGRLVGWLDQIALEGESEEWRRWARGELARE